MCRERVLWIFELSEWLVYCKDEETDSGLLGLSFWKSSPVIAGDTEKK
jgi:hypothetical protein